MLVVVVLLAFVADWHCFCSYHRYCYCCCYYGSQLVSLICPSFYKAGDGCCDDYGDKDGDVCGDGDDCGDCGDGDQDDKDQRRISQPISPMKIVVVRHPHSSCPFYL